MPREYSEDSDYKRKRRNEENIEGNGNDADQKESFANKEDELYKHHDVYDAVQLNEKTAAYLEECLGEKKVIDKKLSHCKRLLDDEIERILVSGRIPKPEIFANVYNEKPIRVAQKVFFPIREFPKFNFVGKILGPKGNTLRQLQEETYCKMIVMGRHSMRDHVKEEELRNSGNLKYAHLSRDLHVEISTVAPPSEAYQRIAYALAEVRKFMIPDANDDIRMEQMREMDGKERMYKKAHYGEHHPQYAAHAPHPASYEKAAKPKVYSILEKARYVMEDPSYGMVKPHRAREHEMYESHGEYARYGSPPPPPPTKHSTSHHHAVAYDGTSYERDYRREYHPHSSSYTAAAAAAYAAKPSNGRSSSYRPSATSGSHSSSHYEAAAGSRSRESVRYRSAPYPKIR